jgi:hypothetical protein
VIDDGGGAGADGEPLFFAVDPPVAPPVEPPGFDDEALGGTGGENAFWTSWWMDGTLTLMTLCGLG